MGLIQQEVVVCECNSFWVEEESKNIDFPPDRLSERCAALLGNTAEFNLA